MKAILILVFLAAAATISLLTMSSHTAVSIAPAVSSVGIATPVTVRLENPHGVRRVQAYIDQNGAQYPLMDSSEPAHRLLFFRKHEPPKSVTFEAGKNKAPNLKEGKARLVVEAVSNDLRGSTDTASAVGALLLAIERSTPIVIDY